jgi:hypothetical protein
MPPWAQRDVVLGPRPGALNNAKIAARIAGEQVIPRGKRDRTKSGAVPDQAEKMRGLFRQPGHIASPHTRGDEPQPTAPKAGQNRMSRWINKIGNFRSFTAEKESNNSSHGNGSAHGHPPVPGEIRRNREFRLVEAREVDRCPLGPVEIMRDSEFRIEVARQPPDVTLSEETTGWFDRSERAFENPRPAPRVPASKVATAYRTDRQVDLHRDNSFVNLPPIPAEDRDQKFEEGEEEDEYNSDYDLDIIGFNVDAAGRRDISVTDPAYPQFSPTEPLRTARSLYDPWKYLHKAHEVKLPKKNVDSPVLVQVGQRHVPLVDSAVNNSGQLTDGARMPPSLFIPVLDAHSGSNGDVDQWPIVPQTYSSHDDSDRESVISHVDSILSVASLASTASEFSATSGYSAEKIETATKELLRIFLEDDGLNHLYQIAILRIDIGPERLRRNIHRLLKLYSRDLQREAAQDLEKHAARLVQFKSAHVAQAIVYKFKTKPHVTAVSYSQPSASEDQSRMDDSDEGDDDDDEDEVTPDEAVNEDLIKDLAAFRQFLTKRPALTTFQKRLEAFIFSKAGPLISAPADFEAPLGQEITTSVVGDSISLKEINSGMQSRPTTLARIARTGMGLLIAAGYLEPPLEPGWTRLRWQCVSGIISRSWLIIMNADMQSEMWRRFLRRRQGVQSWRSRRTCQEHEPLHRRKDRSDGLQQILD